jgi:predicted HTH domain antitoxin
MHTLTDDELKREPQSLLDDAHRGESTLVTADGQAIMMTLPLGANASTAASLLDLASQLYDREEIGLGRAAEIAGLAYSEMMDELGRRGIATIRLQPGELERELAAFGP